MKTIAEKTRNSNRSSNKPFFSGNGTRFHNGGKSSFFEPVSSFALGGEVIQAKLEVGAPDSPAEREAETIADRVMRMAKPAFVQRKCTTCDDTEKIRRKPLIETISRNSSGNAAPVSGNLSSRIQNARGGGSSLDSSTQNFMSSRFGADFSNVRVHTDSNAVQMSRELSAHAFTVGNDLFFNQGKYNPGSDDGKRLLAHELTHVVQQKNMIYRQPSSIPIPVDGEGNLRTEEVGYNLHWENVDENTRILYVMEVLIDRYNFPVNGAAGLVGNLLAESGLIPSRIEGSRASTPMTAPSLEIVNNQRRRGEYQTFSPEQIRDRQYRTEGDPFYAGVGLAQWTSGNRRRGLFEHVYEGRTLGTNILFNMDAQIDYLVNELENSYRSTHRQITDSSVSLNDASDLIVYDFERPGSIMGENNGRRVRLSREHPNVQTVFNARRRLSLRALNVYQATHN